MFLPSYWSMYRWSEMSGEVVKHASEEELKRIGFLPLDPLLWVMMLIFMTAQVLSVIFVAYQILEVMVPLWVGAAVLLHVTVYHVRKQKKQKICQFEWAKKHGITIEDLSTDPRPPLGDTGE